MNINEIYGKIRHLLSRIYQYIKLVRSLPHAGKYFIASFIMIIIFIIITFPYDYLIKKKIYDNEGKSFRTFSMQKLDFSVIGETYIENIEMVLNNSNEISSRNIILNLSLNPYRLFVTKRVLADFQFDAFKFTTGTTELLANLNGNIDVVMDKIKKVPASGELKLILADAKLRMSDISIPGPMGPFTLKLDEVNIQNGIAEVDIVNGVARIKNFKLSGTDINCSATGTVELSERSENSKLDLNITIDTESAVLEQYKDLITAMTRNNPLTLTIRGTLNRPDVKIAGAGAEKNQ